MIKPDSHVYFARCYNHAGVDMQTIKIGLSNDPDRRVASLGFELPFTFEMLCTTPGDMFLEYFVHMWLKGHKISREYFKDCEEIARIVDHVKRKGRLPFPIKRVGREGAFIHLRPTEYMDRKGITFTDIEYNTGIGGERYEKLLQTTPHGNRRFLAALSVTAVKMGHKIEWARDFNPVMTDHARSQALDAAEKVDAA